MITRDFKNTIELTNNGNLSLFFTGTGNSFSKKYFQTNLLIVKGNAHVLVDCGSLCPYALENLYNTKLKNIDTLIVTHPHADHIGGVEELAFTSFYSKKEKLNLIITNEFKKTLWKNSLQGGMGYSEKGKMTFNDYFSQIEPSQLSKKPFPMYEVNYKGINLKIFRTHHVSGSGSSFKNSQYSVGLVIDNKVLFTGDTQFRPEQLLWLNNNFNFEAIFHDCDLSGGSSGVHASYSQMKTLPEELKAKMHLCHYNEISETVDIKKDGFAGFVKSGIYYEFK